MANSYCSPTEALSLRQYFFRTALVVLGNDNRPFPFPRATAAAVDLLKQMTHRLRDFPPDAALQQCAQAPFSLLTDKEASRQMMRRFSGPLRNLTFRRYTPPPSASART